MSTTPEISSRTVPTRIGRDSTSYLDIPTQGLFCAMGYFNGSISQWPQNAWNYFTTKGIHVAAIDVIGNRIDADILDVETGDATVSTAVDWVRAKLAKYPTKAGWYPPILYANRSTLTPLFNALNAAGFQVVRDFRLGIATLDGTEAVADMTGVTYIQYKGEDQTGGHYDESLIYDMNWKTAPVPVPPPPPVPVPPPLQHGVLVTLPAGATRPVVSADGVHWQ